MNLAALLDYLAVDSCHGPTDVPVTGVAYDSRKVEPGFLFVAIKGYHADGHRYIPQAVERGAAAVVGDRRYLPATLSETLCGVPLVVVENSRAALAPLAAAWYGFPAHQMGMIGITGTKGKTTTTMLCSHVLDQCGARSGMISTVDFKIGPRQWHNTLRQSTPEALEIQAMLRDMAGDGCTHAVLEASSHGLSAGWDRLGHCAFDVAVCTNVTHEHLDYHGSVEQYRRDKARLFAMLDSPAPTGTAAKARKVAIVNADDPYHQMFLDAAPATAERLTVALHAPADLRAHDIAATLEGTQARVTTPAGACSLSLRLPGRFNVLNALAALGVALSQGIAPTRAAAALTTVHGVRGRMERIEQGQPFGVLVDYAHNPDSFTQVMEMMRPLTRGAMIAVFGSAGERDVEKRSQQGAIAAHFCDLLVLTDEDPRGEDREAIIADIARGAEEAGKVRGSGYLVVPDRAEAIRTAFERAQPGDLVLLLGKGHESSIEYAGSKLPWNETAQARETLAAMGYPHHR